MEICVDLNKVSMKDFYVYLETRKMFPSHKILERDNKKYLEIFEDLGFKTVDKLFKAISSKKKCEDFSVKHKIDFEYITILRRHIGGFIVKPRLLSEFSLLDDSIIELLSKKGIKNTKDLRSKIQELAIPKEHFAYLNSILELTKLRYVAGKYTDGLFLSGYETIDKIAVSNPQTMNTKLNETMRTYNIANVNLGISDSEFLISDAKLFIKWFRG